MKTNAKIIPRNKDCRLCERTKSSGGIKAHYESAHHLKIFCDKCHHGFEKKRDRDNHECERWNPRRPVALEEEQVDSAEEQEETINLEADGHDYHQYGPPPPSTLLSTFPAFQQASEW